MTWFEMSVKYLNKHFKYMTLLISSLTWGTIYITKTDIVQVYTNMQPK